MLDVINRHACILPHCAVPPGWPEGITFQCDLEKLAAPAAVTTSLTPLTLSTSSKMLTPSKAMNPESLADSMSPEAPVLSPQPEQGPQDRSRHPHRI